MYYVIISHRKNLSEKLLRFESEMSFADTIAYVREQYPSYAYQESWIAKANLRLAIAA